MSLEGAALAERYNLPVVEGGLSLPEGAWISVLKDRPTVWDRTVARLWGGDVEASLVSGPGGKLITPLMAALEQEREHRAMIAKHTDTEFDKRLVIYMDAGARSRRGLFVHESGGFYLRFTGAISQPRRGILPHAQADAA